jgi:hypothetical protein
MLNHQTNLLLIPMMIRGLLMMIRSLQSNIQKIGCLEMRVIPINGGLPNTEVLFDISSTSKEDEIFALDPRWLMVNIEQVGSYLDTGTMTSKNHTLPGYCQELVYVINSDPSDTLIGQNQVTVGGNPGCRVEWKDSDSYNFEVYTIVDGKLFKLIYTDNQLSVPETLPLANKMLESFKILK